LCQGGVCERSQCRLPKFCCSYTNGFWFGEKLFCQKWLGASHWVNVLENIYFTGSTSLLTLNHTLLVHTFLLSKAIHPQNFIIISAHTVMKNPAVGQKVVVQARFF